MWLEASCALSQKKSRPFVNYNFKNIVQKLLPTKKNRAQPKDETKINHVPDFLYPSPSLASLSYEISRGSGEGNC